MSMFRFPPAVLSGAAGLAVSFLLAAPAPAAEALNIKDAKEKGITVIFANVDATTGPATQLRDTFIGQNFVPAGTTPGIGGTSTRRLQNFLRTAGLRRARCSSGGDLIPQVLEALAFGSNQPRGVEEI
jgi:hypothetical protein